MVQVNPFPLGSAAADAWSDQFDAALKQTARSMFEERLHTLGICSEQLSDATMAVFDLALECGAVSMGLQLGAHGRLKEETNGTD